MKWWVIAGSVVLVGGLGVVFFLKKGSEVSCAEVVPPPKVVAFGDSLIAGVGADTETNLVAVLARESGVPIENLGVSGDTTTQGRARLTSVLDT
jgi:lysophospholipase L1-like esterase